MAPSQNPLPKFWFIGSLEHHFFMLKTNEILNQYVRLIVWKEKSKELISFRENLQEIIYRGSSGFRAEIAGK